MIMIKLFFITFFIAELIIALSIILTIYKLDKAVNALNKSVTLYQARIKESFLTIRFLFKEFNNKFLELMDDIYKRREEYIIQIIKNVLIYGSFFCLKGKYKKTLLGYQFAKEIYEGIKES